MSIYIQSASQISMQEPLSEQWMKSPILPAVAFNSPLEPDFKRFILPAESRRMGRLLKRAVAVSLDALQKGGCEMPDAIISGTGLGCVENTEKFLNAVIDNDEECLPPTPFMQSTHNTVSSQIALKLQCHGYNSTYSHRGTSFDSALLDAVMQLQVGRIFTALVGGYDEMTPAYFKMLGKLGYWRSDAESDVDSLKKSGINGSVSGGSAVSLLLANSFTENTLCHIDGAEIYSVASLQEMCDFYFEFVQKYLFQNNHVDAVMCGLSGDQENDAVYRRFVQQCCPEADVLWYKHLFGESFCASAYGIYTAACVLKDQKIPPHLFYQSPREVNVVKNILVVNHFQKSDFSLTLLSR